MKTAPKELIEISEHGMNNLSPFVAVSELTGN